MLEPTLSETGLIPKVIPEATNLHYYHSHRYATGRNRHPSKAVSLQQSIAKVGRQPKALSSARRS